MADLPVLLVHGFASSFERNWRQPGWVALLEDAGREVIGVDLLGHGAAPKPHDPAAYGDLGARVRDALPPDRQVDAVGFSLGASVLLRVAVERPERFARLVLIGVGANLFGSGDPEPIAQAIEGSAEPSSSLAQAFAHFADNGENDAAALAACIRRSPGALDPAALAAVSCPVLVVIGDRDFNWPADGLVSALPDASLRVLRHVDHLGTPNDFAAIDATLSFLGAV